ncbi:MAG: bifunctional diaminohydroxyphosphoribosylaminopyrimidine deaminase/5-amino-6-(5-phosphoribosylamino)uracil reductase RibD [Actinobacteria bacterium]|nr:bifunctional diaminohydroxyphosphoribosylaminopyrimidine deaminase/5-amino-6-(5-phosphoribosylamino)uracil reductase RibD [Actinomycetota bacterium]
MHEKFMRKAMELAELGQGKTSPNPMVGAVVVKNNRIIGEGYHEAAGKPHAEVMALRQAGNEAKDAILYTTIEPCCTYGRTSPCTEAIISSGIKKVVAGMVDPNPKVEGKGLAEIHSRGIEVFAGVLSREIAKQNEVYIKYITTKLPFVILKSAISINGKITTKTSKWITTEDSRREVHRLRSECDAVMVGIGTVLADDPLLTVRLGKEQKRSPIRVVVDSAGKIPLESKLVMPSTIPVALITTEKTPKAKVNELEKKGIKVFLVSEEDGRVNLLEALKELGKKEIASILLEGGASLNASAIKMGLVDKYIFFIAPSLIVESSALDMVAKDSNDFFKELRFSRVRKIGSDLMVEAYPA